MPGDVEAGDAGRPARQQPLLDFHGHVERVPQPQPVAQVADHAVEGVGDLAELPAAAEVGPGVEVAAADAAHEADERQDRPGDVSRQDRGQEKRRDHRGGGGRHRPRLAPPHAGQEIGLRRHGTDDPDQVVADAEGGGRGQVVGAVVAEVELPEGLGVAGPQQWVAGVGECEKLAGAAPPGPTYAPLIRVGQQDAVRGEEEQARVFAHRQAADEIGERVQVEVHAQDAADSASAVAHRGGAGDAGHALVVEHVGRQPH